MGRTRLQSGPVFIPWSRQLLPSPDPRIPVCADDNVAHTAVLWISLAASDYKLPRMQETKALSHRGGFREGSGTMQHVKGVSPHFRTAADPQFASYNRLVCLCNSFKFQTSSDLQSFQPRDPRDQHFCLTEFSFSSQRSPGHL